MQTSIQYPDPSESQVADTLSRIATPALIICAEAARRNIRRLAEYGASHNLAIRPHSKTHKMRAFVEMQLEAGAIGITAAKVSEAEVITEPGDDVLVAYPPVGPSRTARLAALARDRTIRAAADSLAAVAEMASAAQAKGTTVGLLVDLDVGMGRTGVPSPEASLQLAQAIDRAPGLRLDGIMIYPGHVWEPPDEQEAALQQLNQLVGQTLELWREHGLSAAIVSGGSTPTAYQSHLASHLTEIRPGTYIFNDMNAVRGGFCSLDDCAARIVATVVSDAVWGQVVIDAGSKTLTNDLCIPTRESGFGHIVEYPASRITRLSEEHGQVDVTACQHRPAVGDRITVIPNHICPCVNLQEFIWWVEQSEPPRQLRVDARGKLQ